MINKYLPLLLFILFYFAFCTKNVHTEKYQNKRNNMQNVKNQIKEIGIDENEVMIGSVTRLSIINDFLVIRDIKTADLLIQLFDRKDGGYEYVSGAIPYGQGPGEVTNMGHLGINENEKEIYVSDHGKLKIFRYPLDSIRHNPRYVADVKKEINNVQFPSYYEYIDENLSYARFIEPTGNIGHNEYLAKWSIETGEVEKIGYSNPNVSKKRIAFAVSIEKEALVECYHNYDLMTIMDADGNLRYNIYGKNWNTRDSEKKHHFGGVALIGNFIIASYSGGDRLTEEYFPKQLLVFNMNGDYIKTFDIGYRIADFIYDDLNNNIIFSFDDMIQFGYLNLDELLDR